MYISDDPQLLEQWDFALNDRLPENVRQNDSVYVAWWKCDKENHSFDRTVRDHSRSPKRLCSFCSGKKFLKGFNDLASKYPELAKQFDEEKSGVSASEIKASGKKKYWWICEEKGHSHIAPMDYKIMGRGCGVCNGRQVEIGVNDFATTHPELAIELNVEFSKMTAEEFTYGFSKKKLYWNCPLAHTYEAWLKHRISGQKCSICSGRNVLKGFNDLESVHPEIAKEYDLKKNKIRPDEVYKGSTESYWWICPSKHNYESTITSRVYNKAGCYFCSNHRVLFGFNDLATICPDVAVELNEEKSGFKANKILAGTAKMAWWKCKNCGYEWNTSVSNRTANGGGSGCHSCAGKVVIKGKNDLLSQRPEVAKTLNEEKSGFKSDEVSYGSRKVGFFNCDNCNREIRAEIRKRSALTNSHLCSNCSGKRSNSEERLANYIQNHCDKDFLIEFNTRQVIKPYELDIYIPELKIAIEFNGTYWHSDAMVRKSKGMSAEEYHSMKFQRCQALGIDLIFVEEIDWKTDEKSVCERVMKSIKNKYVITWSYI